MIIRHHFRTYPAETVQIRYKFFILLSRKIEDVTPAAFTTDRHDICAVVILLYLDEILLIIHKEIETCTFALLTVAFCSQKLRIEAPKIDLFLALPNVSFIALSAFVLSHTTESGLG
jgi:hypothetical protein